MRKLKVLALGLSRRLVSLGRLFRKQSLRCSPVPVKVDPIINRWALLVYIPYAFDSSLEGKYYRSHSNIWRCRAIAELIHCKGYNVEIIDWNEKGRVPKNRYALVVGLGAAFENAALRNSTAGRVYLGTGAHWRQVNLAVQARVDEFHAEYGVRVPVPKLPEERGAALSDVVALVGSDWVAETYLRATTAKVVCTPNSVTDGVLSTLGEKDFLAARSHFLWMAAYGALRRRLDVVLRVFMRNPQLNLWVCGEAIYEKEFMAVFREALDGCSNIHLVGWVDVASSQYQGLTARCGYLIYPSVSDGMPGSVVNAMASGVVPIVTQEAGIDTRGVGIELSSGDETAIEAAVLFASQQSSEELERRSSDAVTLCERVFTKEAFITAFNSVLDVATGVAMQ